MKMAAHRLLVGIILNFALLAVPASPGHAAAGGLDALDADIVGLSYPAAVYATAEQPDGKTIITGSSA